MQKGRFAVVRAHPAAQHEIIKVASVNEMTGHLENSCGVIFKLFPPCLIRIDFVDPDYDL